MKMTIWNGTKETEQKQILLRSQILSKIILKVSSSFKKKNVFVGFRRIEIGIAFQ